MSSVFRVSADLCKQWLDSLLQLARPLLSQGQNKAGIVTVSALTLLIVGGLSLSGASRSTADSAARPSAYPMVQVANMDPVVSNPNPSSELQTNDASLEETSGDNGPIRGVVRASAQALISTDLVASVRRIGFKTGEKFKTGEVLISFDCTRQDAEVKAGTAIHREMLSSYKSAQLLRNSGFGSRLEVETAKARVDRAVAELEGLRAKLKHCDIEAPFEGGVVDISIREHEFSTPGKPLISILSTKDPEIELVVPSRWLSWITPGIEFEFFVEETQQSYKAAVTRIGAAADSVSQTLKVFAAFKTLDPTVLPGNSGTARFSRREG